jgi:hypothetical protein
MTEQESTYWRNQYRLTYTVESYLWRYNNYKKYLDDKNEFIFKSTFGKADIRDVEAELKWWYNKCVGANNEIKIK